MHVLIVDDDQMVATIIAECLAQDLDVSIAIAATGAMALYTCLQRAPDVVLLDIELPDISGLELLHQLVMQLPKATIIVLSGYDAPGDRKELPEGLIWLVKPIELAVLTEHIRKTGAGAPSP